ncbi:MAG: gamma-glutamyl-gamma-aminobutyrate hydrolase family protein [Lachnospiraceae bacterium]|nr:gamma-glutamyl-gamma-aminobutyrate hydrolase family protein [uncultured Acetatifactor sp.]MCI8287781.1 gamma-glutamyl-gamma-aminobutyrate hydrolase family protein [Lachnospiraceae bacterium]
MRIAIVGKKSDTYNYVRYIQSVSAIPVVTINSEDVCRCDALLLPGGGDITPAFFGEQNHGSRNIDTKLDILQLHAFDTALCRHIPVLGICKGMQVINVGLGGTIIQNLNADAARRHQYDQEDKYHSAVNIENAWLYHLYGEKMTVNSAHHQALGRLGRNLTVVQTCPEDGCIEAVAHETMPILGVQWHPERIDEQRTGIKGEKVLAYFLSVASASA